MDTITIKDIAKKCGVAVSTVSRALNNHPDINPKTREKILETMQQYHYVPNNSARNLKRSDAKAIAILMKGMENPFFSEMIAGIEREAQKNRYACMTQRVDLSESEVDMAIELVKEKKLRGIIFLGGNFEYSCEKADEIPVPFVLSTVGISKEKAKQWVSISVDDFAESYKMTEHLCKLGHKRIAVLTASKNDESVGKLRLQGYLKALETYGIDQDPALVWHMDPDKDFYSMETGYRMTKQKLREGVNFSAIFAVSDTLAIGALRALYEEGVKVPESCSVAGFDGLEIGKYVVPSLTTISQPIDQMAKETVQILLRMIKEKKKYESKKFPGEMILRESTAEYQI